MKPEILDPVRDEDRINQLKFEGQVIIVDNIESQIEELKKIKPIDVNEVGNVWAYFPWSRLLTHILSKNYYRLVRLSRNQNLITPKEQEKFTRQRIGIAGLNVGNPGAVCIVLEGGGEGMKFADNDVLELSNLNRFRAGLGNLGVNKAILSAQQAYEIDPFYDIEIFDKGISEDNIDKFLAEPKIDLLIEEMDNMPLKIKIREKARHYKIPVLMVTGNGPGLIVDIERYDLEPNLQLLNGHLKNDVRNRVLALTDFSPAQEKINLARDFMGAEFLVDRLRESFDLVGKELAGIPQLSEASFLRGAILCYFARQIAVGGNATSGRYFLQIGDVLR